MDDPAANENVAADQKTNQTSNSSVPVVSSTATIVAVQVRVARRLVVLETLAKMFSSTLGFKCRTTGSYLFSTSVS